MAEGLVGFDPAANAAVTGQERVLRVVGGAGQFAGFAAAASGGVVRLAGPNTFSPLPGSAAVTRVSNAAGRVLRRVDDAVAIEKNAPLPHRGFTGQFGRLDPNDIRFSQTTAGGRGRAGRLRESMRNGWDGPAVDAVRTQDGLVTIDNTRIAIARELGIPEVPAKIRLPRDRLPESMLGRFGEATTWGQALLHRTGGQRPPLGPTGTPMIPLLPQ